MGEVKVLVTVPRLNISGGVAGYYLGLRDHLDEDKRYFEIGAIKGEGSRLSGLRRMASDYWRFHLELSRCDYQLVHVNPSLGPKSVIRDGLLVLIAKMHRCPVLVFFRGWNPTCEAQIRRSFAGLFRWVYGKADAFIVLANEFKEKLREMGITSPVYIDTTLVNEQLIKDAMHLSTQNGSGPVKILFLSRLAPDKGLCESIEAFARLRERYQDVELVIAGDGSERKVAEDLVKSKKISGVKFLGFVHGQEKVETLVTADIFLFPSFYGEGMPNAVLEAMALGLPIVTSPVGGLKDFFENERMGFITDSKDPDVLAGLLGRLIDDSHMREEMGEFNRRYALERFTASNVAARLVDIYEQVGRTAKEN
jgi:glycosyltransferase involved in cell wall biosynthesis